MAPPGVNTLFDPLDIMTFPSVFIPVLPRSESTSVFSSLLQPLPQKVSSLPESSFILSSIHSDHDYVIKSHMNKEYGLSVDTDDYCDQAVGDNNSSSSGGGDAMLSRCAVDFEKVSTEGIDTDFLIDLDDLNFNLDGLDPYCEVAMEDSFQDFIDSALEQSYSSLLNNISTCNDKQPHGTEAVILNKEQFLSTLNLRPTQENTNSDECWSSPSTSQSASSSSFSSNSLFSNTTTYVNCHKTSNLNNNNSSSCNSIPTRQCSYLEFESVFKAVYSTAHPQECVRICPSNLITNTTERTNIRDCRPLNSTPDIVMSPLFIDTSLSGVTTKSFKSSDDSLDITMEEDNQWRLDQETVDIMTWLSEGQQEDYQQYSDSNNNIIHSERVNKVSHFADTPNYSSLATPSLDFESFVDLDDLETETQQSDPDYMLQQTNKQSKNSITNVDFTDHFTSRTTFPHSSDSDIQSEISFQGKLSPVSSDLSYCNISPAWSRTDSFHSLVSPHPLTIMDLSSSNFDDDTDDNSMKSPFALLNLFSDENATSLLHTDSTVPNIRFI
uniref:Uncharacterized protein n=1 Tax=Arion vulgaris TaxID=1028688 RepID=A0A0B7AYR7_9EUPU